MRTVKKISVEAFGRLPPLKTSTINSDGVFEYLSISVLCFRCAPVGMYLKGAMGKKPPQNSLSAHLRYN